MPRALNALGNLKACRADLASSKAAYQASSEKADALMQDAVQKENGKTAVKTKWLNAHKRRRARFNSKTIPQSNNAAACQTGRRCV